MRHPAATDERKSPATLPVCAVIPAYNRATRLERCLESVWAQRPASPAEVIVVDDYSSDDTSAVAATLGARVIRHSRNRGAAAARNTAIEATSCEWIAFLDSDDEWLPHHLAHLWELRDTHGLVGASVLYCFDDPVKDRFHGPVERHPMVLRSPDTLIGTFNIFAASACMIRRDVAVAMGGFHQWWGVEDLDLWVRVLEEHSAICSPRVTVLYHVHEDQLSLHWEKMHHGHRGVAIEHLKRTGSSSTSLERWEAVAAWDAMRALLTAGNGWAAVRRIPGFLRTPQRVISLTMLLWTRFLARRRTAEVLRDGDASIALLVRDASKHRAVMQVLGDRPIRDLSQLSLPSALLGLMHRPSRVVVTGSARHVTLLRRFGVLALTADQTLEAPSEIEKLCSYQFASST